MGMRKPNRKQMLTATDQLGPDDGLDPRWDRRETGRPTGRKALQVCREVQRTLSVVLVGECDDPILRDLLVESVVPAPHSGRLLVTLRLAPSAEARTVGEILDRVHRVAPQLRAEVATAINRRKVPELTYRIV